MGRHLVTRMVTLPTTVDLLTLHRSWISEKNGSRASSVKVRPGASISGYVGTATVI